jgi:hypothetical protein
VHQLLDSSSDVRQWKEALASLPTALQDVYFQNDYCELEVLGQAAEAKAFVFSQDSWIWFYPFLLNKIESFEGDWFDIQSQYGYAGPLANTDDSKFLASAHTAFSDWCQESRVVAEFVRLHPLMENERWLDPQMEVVYDRATVSLDLTKSAESGIESLMSKTARYMLRRAESGGLTVEIKTDGETFARFVELYLSTMDRLQADRYYYFNNLYFDGLSELIGRQGWLITVASQDETVGAALFLKGKEWLHYHLSASAPGQRYPGATNLLIRTAAELGREAGLTKLHLGGGGTSAVDDSLLAFKQSMATDQHGYKIGKRIHNSEVYRQLKSSWEEANPGLVEKFGRRLLCYRIGSN